MDNNKPIGYYALINIFDLKVLPHFRKSVVTTQAKSTSKRLGKQYVHYYAQSYKLKSDHDPILHLEFAIKHEGINLEILKSVFQKINPEILVQYIQSAPAGKYSRKVWFLYEWLIESTLAVDDLKGYKYIELFDPEEYITVKGKKSIRHGIINNSLGSNQYCPIVRKTPEVIQFIKKNYDERVKTLIGNYDLSIIERASNYLFAKETKSSFEIEREKPDRRRLTRFVNLLQNVSKIDSITKKELLQIQKLILDPRFCDIDYRYTQNYVGETLNPYIEKLHYISPKPEDVPTLMEELLKSYEHMVSSEVHPVIIAACIAFGFVFIHPFEDGNGRLHRFLIHYTLVKTKFTPEGVIFPVSAVMLNKLKQYDDILESFSRPLMALIEDYHLDNDGFLEVYQETRSFYQFHDYTEIVGYLFKCIAETIEQYFKQELEFIINYDKTKKEMRKIVDMPDKLTDLFIKTTLQNDGTLSKSKQKRYFEKLTDDEIDDLSSVVVKFMVKKL